MPLSNSFVKRVGKEDRYRKGWHPLIIGGLTILLSIFRAYQISDTPFLLLYHCSLNLDSLHRLRHFVHENLFWVSNCGILCMKNFFESQTAAFCAWKSFLSLKLRHFVYEKLFWIPNCGILYNEKYLFTKMFGTLTGKIYFCAEMVDVLMVFRLWTEKSWKSILVRPLEWYHYLPFDKQMLNP